MDNNRRSYGFYWGIEEMLDLLDREDSWMVGGIIKSTVVHELEGGLSSAFRAWLDVAFGVLNNFEEGVTVQTHEDSVIVIFVKYHQ